MEDIVQEPPRFAQCNSFWKPVTTCWVGNCSNDGYHQGLKKLKCIDLLIFDSDHVCAPIVKGNS